MLINSNLNPWDLKSMLEFQTHMLVARLAPNTGSFIGYYVMWDDGVANRWNEFYTELPLALARMAVLARLDTSRPMFAEGDAEDFSPVARDWLRDRVEK